MNKILIFLLPVSILVTGCGAVLPLSVATTTMLISDERSLGTMMDDKMIANTINSQLSKQGSGHLFLAFGVTVFEGRVLLTGSVASRQCIDEVLTITWSTRGVKEVMNELAIELKALKRSANDTLIKNAIDSKMLVEKNFISTNYKVSVNNSIVYLVGVAQNNSEMNRALYIASNMQGVDRVVNYIILKNDPRRG
jgi:osmotically-inducible protein OsmY